MTLLDFIPTRNPGYVRPFHLSRLCAALDKIGSEPMRRIFWHGPRCGLTQTLMAAMQQRPDLTYGYASRRKMNTDQVIARVGRPGIFSAHGPTLGRRISGAIFLDDYNAGDDLPERLMTRLLPGASIFIFADERTFGESPHAEFRAAALRLGFRAGWV